MTESLKQELKNNPTEMQKCQDNSLYFHNKYVVAEGEQKKTQAQFNKWIEEQTAFRNTPKALPPRPDWEQYIK